MAPSNSDRIRDLEFELEPNLRVIHAPADCGGVESFSARLIEEIENSMTRVIRNRLI